MKLYVSGFLPDNLHLSMVKTQRKGKNKLYFKRLNFLRARSKHRKQTQSDAVRICALTLTNYLTERKYINTLIDNVNWG